MSLSADALTTIAACEEALGLSAGDDDDFLTRLIEAMSSRIKRYCNRTFYFSDELEEYVRAGGTNFLAMTRRPISSITSVEYNDATVSTDDYECTDIAEFANAGLIYNSGGWYWPATAIRNIARDLYAGSEQPLYKVTYDAGWKTPEQSRTGSITAYADAGGGLVTVTSTRHLLSTGDSVTISGSTNYNDTYSITVVDADSFTITETFAGDDAAGTWRRNNYTRDMPYDLEQACIELVTLKYRTRGLRTDIKSEKLLSWSASYESPSDLSQANADIPTAVKGLLQPYKGIGIA